MSTDPEPLIFNDVAKMDDLGMRVLISCREPHPCMGGELHGFSALVKAAMKRLGAIHNAAHAIIDEEAL